MMPMAQYNVVRFWKRKDTLKIEERHDTTTVMPWNLMLMLNERQNHSGTTLKIHIITLQDD
jgi:hypothetical protein